MHRAARMSLFGIGIIAVLLVVAVAVFAVTFDINDYKDRIAGAVQDATGRTLVFDGDISLVFFPSLGVELGPLRLSNGAGFGSEPMMTTRRALVSVRLFPLLKGDVKFGHLALDGLTLNLSRKGGGASNWDDLVGRSAEESAGDAAGEQPFSLEIQGVSITDARLNWDDRVTDTRFVLRGIDLTTGRIFQGAPFPVDARLDFDCAKPDARGTLTLSGKSSIDFDNREYGHMDMRLSVTAEGKAIPGGTAKAEVAVQFAVLDFNKEHAQVSGVTATAYGATVRMDGTVEGITQGLRKLAGTVTVDPFDGRQTVAALGGTLPLMADDAALTRMGGMAEVEYTSNDLHLKAIQLDLDGTRMTGQGRLRGEEQGPYIYARLDVGDLDLDRYLPPDRSDAAAKPASDKGELVIDRALLRGLHLDIEAAIAALRVEGVNLTDVKFGLKSKDGVLRAEPVSASLYGGSLDGTLVVDAKAKYPKTSLGVTLAKVDVARLSGDVTGKEEYQGILDAKVDLSCTGAYRPVMLRSLDGTWSFFLADGVFPGVNLIKMAKATHASKDRKDGKVEAADTDATQFGSIAGTGTVTAGVVRNKDLEVKAPGLRADGQGTVVLPTKQIDYLLKVKLVPTKEGQGGKSSKEMFGIMVPIRVAGTWEDPRYWVSVSEYAKALGGAVLDTAGALLGGVRDALKGVGQAVDESCCEESTEEPVQPKRKKFLGIF